MPKISVILRFKKTIQPPCFGGQLRRREEAATSLREAASQPPEQLPESEL